MGNITIALGLKVVFLVTTIAEIIGLWPTRAPRFWSRQTLCVCCAFAHNRAVLLDDRCFNPDAEHCHPG
jgi:hypothetical protein